MNNEVQARRRNAFICLMPTQTDTPGLRNQKPKQPDMQALLISFRLRRWFDASTKALRQTLPVSSTVKPGKPSTTHSRVGRGRYSPRAHAWGRSGAGRNGKGMAHYSGSVVPFSSSRRRASLVAGSAKAARSCSSKVSGRAKSCRCIACFKPSSRLRE